MVPPADQAAREAVARASTATEALRGLATALRSRWPVDRASLRVVDRSDDRLVIVSVWSLEGTVLTEGTRIPLESTSFPDVVRTGGPVIFESPERAPTLIDQILLDEGLQSWAVIPLREGGSIEALLALSAREPGTFRMGDGADLTALAETIQEGLLGLLAAGRPGG